MTTKTLLGALGLATAIGVAGIALAQEAPAPDAPPPGPTMGDGPDGGMMMGGHMGRGFPMFLFDQIDVNKDGKITQDEVLAFRQARTAGTDANKDGKLSADEIAAQMIKNMTPMIEQRAKDMVARLDTDGDGVLSVEELAASSMGGPMAGRETIIFERIDANGDGAITKDEVQAAMARMHGPKGGPRPHHGWGDWMRGGGDNDN